MGQHGGSRHGRGTENNKRPYSLISIGQTFDGRWISRWWTPHEEIPSGEEFLHKLPRADQVGRGDGLHYRHLPSCGPGARTSFQKFVANVAALAKITDKMTLMTVINGAVRPSGAVECSLRDS